jgi:hypothetical protein
VASSRARSADIKLIVSATVAVLLAGFLIAGAALIATRGAGNIVCGRLNLGSAADIRKNLQDDGPSFKTNGSNCGFWLAIANGDIVAYRVKQPSGCTLQLKDRATRWVCGGRDLDPTALATYAVTIQKFGTVDAVVVDLVTPGASTTTTTT